MLIENEDFPINVYLKVMDTEIPNIITLYKIMKFIEKKKNYTFIRITSIFNICLLSFLLDISS